MFKRSLATLAASLSLLTGTAAQASSAQALSLSNAPGVSRASTTAGASNEAAGSALGYVMVAVVAGLGIWALIEIVGGDDDDPDSP